jgi:hypothetical protein
MKRRTLKKRKARHKRRLRILDRRACGHHTWWSFLANQRIGLDIRGYEFTE